jgi:hypothetical protein
MTRIRTSRKWKMAEFSHPLPLVLPVEVECPSDDAAGLHRLVTPREERRKDFRQRL